MSEERGAAATASAGPSRAAYALAFAVLPAPGCGACLLGGLLLAIASDAAPSNQFEHEIASSGALRTTVRIALFLGVTALSGLPLAAAVLEPPRRRRYLIAGLALGVLGLLGVAWSYGQRHLLG